MKKNILIILCLIVQVSIAQTSLKDLKIQIQDETLYLGDYFDIPFDLSGNFQNKEMEKKYLAFAAHKKDLEDILLERLKKDLASSDTGQKQASLLLCTYLKYTDAEPVIWEGLLNCQFMYGWEGPNYSLVDTYLSPEQYPLHTTYWWCIQYITHQKKTRAPKKQLQVLEEKTKVFRDKYASKTFAPEDKFEVYAQAYVMLKIIVPEHTLIKEVEQLLQKRIVWGIYINSYDNMEDALTECIKYQEKTEEYLEVLEVKKGEKSEYRVCMGLYDSEKAAKEMLGRAQEYYKSDAYVFEFPCRNLINTYENDVFCWKYF